MEREYEPVDGLEGGDEPERELPETWQVIFDQWPESMHAHIRPLLARLAETNHLTPEMYQLLGLQIEQSDEDKALGAAYGAPDKKRVAEADYQSRVIRLFPHLQTFADKPGLITHVLSHELGHFLGGHLVNPVHYRKLVSQRPTWSNGRYVQGIAARAPEHSLHEMLADDLADYLNSSSPEEMLTRRLERAGDRTVLAEQDSQTYSGLLDETRSLFTYFKVMLDPKRQEREETRLDDSLQGMWLELDGLGAEDFIQAIPEDIGMNLWDAPARPSQKNSDFDYFAWLFSKE